MLYTVCGIASALCHPLQGENMVHETLYLHVKYCRHFIWIWSNEQLRKQNHINRQTRPWADLSPQTRKKAGRLPPCDVTEFPLLLSCDVDRPCALLSHVTRPRRPVAIMHAVGRFWAGAIKAAKPAFLSRNATANAVKSLAAYHTSRGYQICKNNPSIYRSCEWFKLTLTTCLSLTGVDRQVSLILWFGLILSLYKV